MIFPKLGSFIREFQSISGEKILIFPDSYQDVLSKMIEFSYVC